MRFEKEILELETRGFINPPYEMLRWLRNSDEFKNIRKFKASSGCQGGSRKYSCVDIFGSQTFYYLYKIEKTDNFVKFLIENFYKQNPTPTRGMRKVFTSILHSNYLTWEGEYHD